MYFAYPEYYLYHYIVTYSQVKESHTKFGVPKSSYALKTLVQRRANSDDDFCFTLENSTA